jgi:hypothetical protein
VGLVIAGALWAAPALALPARIAWNEQETVVKTWVRPAAPGSETGREVQRVASLQGQILAFDRADTSLYVVFLDSPSRMPQLRRVIDRVGGPGRWRQADRPELAAFLDDGASYEWLPLRPSGALTVVADSQRQPGKTYLAVVNGAGDILGSRPLWDATAPAEGLAASRAQILSDRSMPGGTD